MKQTVSGNIKCFDISCSDEDIEKSIVNEIKLIKRKPTFDYILNDLAFESLKIKAIYGEASNQDKFDFDYQLKLKDKEINRLNNIINEFDKWLIGEKMMFYRSNDGERLIRFRETKYKWLELKKLKESGNNE